MNRIRGWYLIITLQLFIIQAVAQTPDFSLVGFGAGVTGGAGGQNVQANSSNFAEYCKSKDPLIIEISGIIEINGSVEITSNKTLLGVGKNAEITKTTLNIKSGTTNVIIKNLKIHHAPGLEQDLISLEGAKKVWVDHCELYNMIGDIDGDGTIETEGEGTDSDKNVYDGSFDAKKASGEITLSWNYFHDAFKTSLMGANDNDNPSDRNLTYHHNIYWNVYSRTPTQRGGTGHFFNNYLGYVYGSAVSSRADATMKIEGNVFENVGSGKIDPDTKLGEGPIGCWFTKKLGTWLVKDNTYINCKGNQPKENESTANSVNIPYDYSKFLQPASQVKETLLKYCGTEAGVKLTNPLWPTSIKQPTKVIKPSLNQSGAYTIYTLRGEKINDGTKINAINTQGIYLAKDKYHTVYKINSIR